jgi:MtrB/PioB family decaheme-associated outer membrane protein
MVRTILPAPFCIANPGKLELHIMKKANKRIQLSTLSVAVHTALLAMCAMSISAHAEEDPEVTALTQPHNFVEFGGIYLSRDSAKFGEYTGLNDSGLEALGNLSVKGGDGYGGGNGTMRWGIIGRDLGLTSRSINASMSNQGLWDLSIGYDGLRHNISDSYQTPQQGGLGDNNFTMPANFGSINANNATPSARVLNATQLGAFHTEEIYTDRDNTSVGAGYNFNRNWSMKFDYNHLEQSGAKLLGTGSQGGIALVGGSTGRAEAVNILMNPTEYTTETFNLALNWHGDMAHLSVGYFGSLFNDKYNSLSWQNALTSGASACVGTACFVNNTMSTAPDNDFHQLNLTGGYIFSPSTKLAGGFSYGVNTQDDSYAPTVIAQASGVDFDMMQAGGLPRLSLDARVVTTHANMKLTHRASRNLVLSGALKYNERDNQTTSNTYLFKHLGNGNYTGVNTPYSNRKVQYEAAADYRLSKAQKISLEYEHEYIKRWCDGVVGGAQCVASPTSDEDKLNITYRLKASDTIRLSTGYTYANRDADFDRNFAANTGDYPVVNAGDKLGYNAYIYDSRTQNMLKAGINWQATSKLDWSLNGRYTDLNYDADLGVQDGKNTNINLDATYAYAQNKSVGAYLSWQGSDRELRNGKDGSPTVAPTQIWTNQQEQDSYAFGLNGRHA